MKVSVAALCAVVVSALAGCSGSSAPVAGSSPRPIPTPTCPSATTTPSATATPSSVANALRKVPFDLPMPDDITVLEASVTQDGIQVVKFTTPTTLRQTVLFIVDRYPKAGYVLGRGDAEATEADAPFVKNGVRGLTRIASLEPCKTLWLIATAASANTKGTSPLLSPHPTSSQTTALPFG